MSDLGKKPERASLAGKDSRARDENVHPLGEHTESLGQFLVELVSDSLLRSGNAALWSDERFLRWKEREIRELGAGRANGAEVRVFAERAISRLRAQRARVRVSEGAPPWREPTVHSTPGRVMEEAADAGSRRRSH